MKFFHGSAVPLEPGTLMVGRGESYEAEWTGTDFFQALEAHRPGHCMPHRDCVFLVDNVDDIDNAGGCTDWCLEVEPGVRLSKHDLNWSSEISCLIGDGFAIEACEVRQAALNYWNGVPHRDESVWEYLTDSALVTRCTALDADGPPPAPGA